MDGKKITIQDIEKAALADLAKILNKTIQEEKKKPKIKIPYPKDQVKDDGTISMGGTD